MLVFHKNLFSIQFLKSYVILDELRFDNFKNYKLICNLIPLLAYYWSSLINQKNIFQAWCWLPVSRISYWFYSFPQFKKLYLQIQTHFMNDLINESVIRDCGLRLYSLTKYSRKKKKYLYFLVISNIWHVTPLIPYQLVFTMLLSKKTKNYGTLDTTMSNVSIFLHFCTSNFKFSVISIFKKKEVGR